MLIHSGTVLLLIAQNNETRLDDAPIKSISGRNLNIYLLSIVLLRGRSNEPTWIILNSDCSATMATAHDANNDKYSE